MPTLSLLHLSDLHLCDDDSEYLHSVHGNLSYVFGPPSLKEERSVLRKALGAWLEYSDWLIISGDITHTGREVDLRQADDLIQGVEHDCSNLPNNASRTFALIPGNHDRYKNPPCPGNVGPFELIFKRYWSIGQGVQFQILSEDLRIQAGFADFSLREDEARRLREIDFSRIDASGREIWKWVRAWGQGCVYEDVLTKLRDESESRISEGWRLIWIIHFAPFPVKLSRVDKWKLRLRHQERLIAAAKQLGVTHILCGHTHVKDRYAHDGVEILCSGAGLRNTSNADASFLAVELGIAGGRLVTNTCQVVSRLDNLGYARVGAM